MKKQVYLANCGNPDFRQDDTMPLPGTTNYLQTVDSVEEAQTKVIEYIQNNDLGGGNWTGGYYIEDGEMVGYFSYNARYWVEGETFERMKSYYDSLTKKHRV